MAREILMTEDEFRDIITECIEYVFNDWTDETKQRYWRELFEVLNISDENLRWATLIKSEVFENAIGEWDRVDGYCLWVND